MIKDADERFVTWRVEEACDDDFHIKSLHLRIVTHDLLFSGCPNSKRLSFELI